jgi:hypothetical protein
MTGNDDGARKPSFSQRHGYVEYPTASQVESLDERARTDIWNFLIYPQFVDASYPDVAGLMIWAMHFALPRHQYSINNLAARLEQLIREGEWYAVYDLLEFLVLHYVAHKRTDYAELVNGVLAANRAGYRVVDSRIVPISNADEANTVEAAAHSTLASAGIHIRSALNLFAVREDPNFGKVIHEAMSGAEAAANVLAGKQGLTLGDALGEVQKRGTLEIHPALIDGWKKLYGFTSDSGGIRHALKMGAVQPNQDIAQYFIITCSAFVNLVAAISSQA